MSKYQFKSILCPAETVTEEQLETDRKIAAFDRTIAHLNRRGFLGAMLSAAAAATLTSTRTAHAQATVPITDVLNFALNLEYLEANFYLYVSTGVGLSSTLNGAGVAVQGAPPKLTLDANTMAVAQALAQDEVNHIADLRSAVTSLGGTPIAQPLINLAANGAVSTQAQFLTAAPPVHRPRWLRLRRLRHAPCLEPRRPHHRRPRSSAAKASTPERSPTSASPRA